MTHCQHNPGDRFQRLPAWSLAVTAATILGMPATLSAEEVEGLALPEKSVTVSSPVQDIIAELFVEDGDRVKKGRSLARLRNEREKTELDRTIQILVIKEFDNQAAANLREQSILSEEEALATAAELALAKLDVKLAQIALEEKTVSSPIDGIVTRKYFEAGEFVDRAQPLFEIIQIDRLYLQFFVGPKIVRRLRRHDLINFWVTEEPQKKRSAEIYSISPAADSGSGLFRVRLLINNLDHKIKAGLKVTGEFFDE